MSVTFLAVLLWQGIHHLNITWFFAITSILLIVFAAGLTVYGIHELNEADVIPPIIEHVWDINPPINQDGTYPFNHEKGTLGLVLKSLVGYDGNPSLTEVLGYLIFWIIIGLYLVKRLLIPPNFGELDDIKTYNYCSPSRVLILFHSISL